jgi:hypothetical protein
MSTGGLNKFSRMTNIKKLLENFFILRVIISCVYELRYIFESFNTAYTYKMSSKGQAQRWFRLKKIKGMSMPLKFS